MSAEIIYGVDFRAKQFAADEPQRKDMTPEQLAVDNDDVAARHAPDTAPSELPPTA